MNLITIILITVTVLYLLVSILYALHGNYPLSGVFIGYAFANMCLYYAGHLL